MKFISFRYQEQVLVGIVNADSVLNLAAAAKRAGEKLDLSSMLAVIRGGEPALQACERLQERADDAGDALVPLSQVQKLAPIPVLTRNAFCVGRNYLDHITEGANARGMKWDQKLPEAPQFFTKATGALIGPGAEVRLDTKLTQRLDYEVELAVVIGKRGRDIAAGDAYDFVFGYTIANDVTARDLQRRHDQWFKGKSLDTTLPLGPCIVTRDAIGDPGTLELSMSINGQERQRARVDQMIFDIPTIIAQLSAGMTLEPGDIIATGTPSGVGFAMNPPQFLHDGDEMLATIDRIGALRNRVVEV
jgi:2-keto-4-pentenoate hydratase/2-oxohepta-3-ene-1,7-dioic acid hydratase in catechol pathway